MLLGAHFSISGGYHKACEEAERLGCNALQLFTKNQMQWKAKPITASEASEFKEARRKAGVAAAMAHDSYLINLASPDSKLRSRSLQAFIHELKRCEALGVESLVTHPGSPTGAGEKAGIQSMVGTLREALKERGPTAILLETTAGQGSTIGWRFEHLAEIIDGCAGDPGLGICVDTCHVFAAGYDLRTEEGTDRTIEEFDRIVGLPRLKAFHMNDSKQGLGCRVDRHEHIGRGKIGRAAFRCIMTDERFERIPKVLETPKEGDMDPKNLAVLRRLSRETACRKR
ncbi:MAG TPA: deoxyribonuclease IV [Planctomycetota bacterium]|nr:deoxyribonuclease IV [Planctomycetota bacterium]